jgi:hypothetical protein
LSWTVTCSRGSMTFSIMDAIHGNVHSHPQSGRW